MSHRPLITASALAAVLSLGVVTQAHAQDSGKEKCYGIAKAGQNDCASYSGTHSCAGQTKDDMSPADWKYVAKGSCKTMGGLSADEAKKKVEAMGKK
ncbi:DUF2282 domain-containing protein [Caldimonas sp. KR1-144]|uniref:BufA1 family periplasmic bufferin-type metallophore n=1 Tax=Caldimonas sp. KR1-144 TaxID=3400911 RepID=UPI003C0672D5